MRELLGIEFDGRGVFSNSITIYFHADLAPQLLNKPLSVIYIGNPVLGGFFRMDKDCQSGFLVREHRRRSQAGSGGRRQRGCRRQRERG